MLLIIQINLFIKISKFARKKNNNHLIAVYKMQIKYHIFNKRNKAFQFQINLNLQFCKIKKSIFYNQKDQSNLIVKYNRFVYVTKIN